MRQAAALLADKDIKESKCTSIFRNVIGLNNVGVGKYAALNNLIGQTWNKNGYAIVFQRTTCATVFTQAIFVERCKLVDARMNAMDLRRCIIVVVDVVITSLKSIGQINVSNF
ncbi:unnamed protein product [Vicia faba]|uniref:Uncharacterized protein n=1 Tax=Vicia faba TaxID=3906 RepID=A0AAV1A1N1_VICFA|nr:unnamed protein product [Vicia faba]